MILTQTIYHQNQPIGKIVEETNTRRVKFESIEGHERLTRRRWKSTGALLITLSPLIDLCLRVCAWCCYAISSLFKKCSSQNDMKEDKFASSGLINGPHFRISLLVLLAVSIFLKHTTFDSPFVDSPTYLGTVVGIWIALLSGPLIWGLIISYFYWLVTRKSVRRVFTTVYWGLFGVIVVGMVFDTLGLLGTSGEI